MSIWSRGCCSLFVPTKIFYIFLIRSRRNVDGKTSKIPGAICGRAKDTSPIQSVQTFSGIHPGVGIGFTPGTNRPGHEPYHSVLSRTDVMNEWSYTSTRT